MNKPPLEQFRTLVITHLESLLAAVRDGEWTMDEQDATRCPHCKDILSEPVEKWRLKAGTLRDLGDVTLTPNNASAWWGSFAPMFGRHLPGAPEPEEPDG